MFEISYDLIANYLQIIIEGSLKLILTTKT